DLRLQLLDLLLAGRRDARLRPVDLIELLLEPIVVLLRVRQLLVPPLALGEPRLELVVLLAGRIELVGERVAAREPLPQARGLGLRGLELALELVLVGLRLRAETLDLRLEPFDLGIQALDLLLEALDLLSGLFE